jgi:hypothetical protein
MTPGERENLKDQLRATLAGRGDGIDLDTPEHWVVEGIGKEKARQFFQSLPRILPPDGILYFEGTTISPDAAKFYERHRAKNAVAVIRDTISPAPETFHMQFAPDALAGLDALLSQHELPAMFDHVKGYRGETLLFTFHDAFDGWLQISQRVPESAVAEFGRDLGVAYRVETTTQRDTKALQKFLELMEDPNGFRKIRFAGEPRWRTWWRRITGR